MTAIPDDPLLQLCLDSLRHQDPLVRGRALMQLGMLGPLAVRAVPLLSATLDDPVPHLRRLAAAALAEIGPAAAGQAIPALMRALQDPDEAVRRAAAMALGEMGADARPAVALLVRALQSDTDSVQRWAAVTLGGIGDAARTAIPALIELLGHPSVRSRVVAAAALDRMGARTTPRLLEALRHPTAAVRRHAARLLGRDRPSPEVRQALAELWHDADADVRDTVRALLDPPAG